MIEVEKKLQKKFEQACENNNLSIVKHFINSPKLREKIDIEGENFSIIKGVYQYGYFDLGDYVLSEHKLSQSDKTMIFSHVFARACYENNMEIIEKIHEDEKYSAYLDLNYNSTWCFRTAYSNARLEVLEFLILEARLSKENEDVQVNMYSIYPLKEEMMKYCEILFLTQQMQDTMAEKPHVRKTKI